MGRLVCVRSGLAGVSLQGNGVQLLFPVPFPSLRGFAGSRMVHPGCPRAAQQSFQWDCGILQLAENNSSAHQLLPPAASGWGFHRVPDRTF